VIGENTLASVGFLHFLFLFGHRIKFLTKQVSEKIDDFVAVVLYFFVLVQN
jgi:hypothetical protein